MNPTDEFYRSLNEAFDHFNRALFAGALPSCMITLQRQRNTMGYFSEERWCSSRGHRAHEIALNPAYFANHRVVDVLQTLVHEQCHLWQHVHGAHRSRSGYHNREWADKMDAIGLVASDTGGPGGRRTGQSMSDYPAPAGRFIAACGELVESGFGLEWIDTWPAETLSCQPRQKQSRDIEFAAVDEPVVELLMLPVVSEDGPVKLQQEDSGREAKRRSKTRYSCSSCGVNIWGKPGIEAICGPCGEPFLES